LAPNRKVGQAGVDGLQLTRMEYRHLPGGDGTYYSVDGYPLRDGLRAAKRESSKGVRDCSAFVGLLMLLQPSLSLS
jgi:hypothetical protein